MGMPLWQLKIATRTARCQMSGPCSRTIPYPGVSPTSSQTHFNVNVQDGCELLTLWKSDKARGSMVRWDHLGDEAHSSGKDDPESEWTWPEEETAIREAPTNIERQFINCDRMRTLGSTNFFNFSFLFSFHNRLSSVRLFKSLRFWDVLLQAIKVD
jgi:hypothetical protein